MFSNIELSVNFKLKNPKVCSIGVVPHSYHNITNVVLDFSLTLTTDLFGYIGFLASSYMGELIENIIISGNLAVSATSSGYAS